MIASRSVYLDRGFAFVPLQRLVNIIVTRFRIHLSKVPPSSSSSSSCPDAMPVPARDRPCQHSLPLPTADLQALADAALMFDNVSADSRIGPLLKNMNKQYVGRDFSKSSQATDKLTPDQVPFFTPREALPRNLSVAHVVTPPRRPSCPLA